MKKPLLVAVALLGWGAFSVSLYWRAPDRVLAANAGSGDGMVTVSAPPLAKSITAAPRISNSDAALRLVFQQGQKELEVSGEAVVQKLLPDDNEGSRHQKFVIRLSSGQTLLIAHNIDVAPRLPNLKEGDTVRFRGPYE
jgi:hypothetical protein